MWLLLEVASGIRPRLHFVGMRTVHKVSLACTLALSSSQRASHCSLQVQPLNCPKDNVTAQLPKFCIGSVPDTKLIKQSLHMRNRI